MTRGEDGKFSALKVPRLWPLVRLVKGRLEARWSPAKGRRQVTASVDCLSTLQTKEFEHVGQLWILMSSEFGELHSYEILITLVGPRSGRNFEVNVGKAAWKVSGDT
jgi:hypothetical protein